LRAETRPIDAMWFAGRRAVIAGCERVRPFVYQKASDLTTRTRPAMRPSEGDG
jgi:hypothetical protein